MSDCFDHAFDAHQSREDALLWGMGEPRSQFKRDPLFYHRCITFEHLITETEKAYLFCIKGTEVWLPKKICRQLSTEENQVYVHRKTYGEIIRRK